MAAQGTFVLVAEATQGAIVLEKSVPAANPTIATIAMQSTEFGTDPSLSFSLFIEESFDSGATWVPASGFPSSAAGGTAGRPKWGGGFSTGLPSWEYAYDGLARILRVTMTPNVAFDWGLTATLQ